MPSTSLHDTSHFPFLEVVDLINTHNVKVESYVSLGGNFRTSSPGGSTSSEPKRSVPRRQSEEPGYTEVLQQTPVNLNIKKSLLVKESQISQVKEFSNFLCMRRCKSLGSLKSLLSHAPQQSGASILCFHILNLLGVHSREWLQSDGCQVAGILLLCECPQGWWTPTGGLQSLITVTSLFTNLPELSHVKPLQSRLILCPLMDYSPPGSSVHEISQARLLEWVAMPSSRGSSQPRDQTCVSCRKYSISQGECLKLLLLSKTRDRLPPLFQPNSPGDLIIWFPLERFCAKWKLSEVINYENSQCIIIIITLIT